MMVWTAHSATYIELLPPWKIHTIHTCFWILICCLNLCPTSHCAAFEWQHHWHWHSVHCLCITRKWIPWPSSTKWWILIYFDPIVHTSLCIQHTSARRCPVAHLSPMAHRPIQPVTSWPIQMRFDAPSPQHTQRKPTSGNNNNSRAALWCCDEVRFAWNTPVENHTLGNWSSPTAH